MKTDELRKLTKEERMEKIKGTNQYEELANRIIDEVSEVVEQQHPEIKLKTKKSKEDGCDSPALIYGEDYYFLEEKIARLIKSFTRRKLK